MRIPVIRGVIERRILVNFRVDPAALAAVSYTHLTLPTILRV